MALFIGLSPRFRIRRPLGGPGPEGAVFTVSELDVWNVAAAELNLAPIIVIDEKTTHANRFRSLWPIFRRKFLQDHEWKGAKCTAKLNLLSDAPLTRWARKFMLPANILRPLRVNGKQLKPGDDWWEIEKDETGDFMVLLCDASDVHLEFIVDIPSVSHIQPIILYAMGVGLAHSVGRAFGKNSQYMLQLAARYQNALLDAKAVDSQAGGTPLTITDTFLVDAREPGAMR